MGGYMAKKFNWTRAEGWIAVSIGKGLQGHFPWEEGVSRARHWFWIGYNEDF